MMKRIIVITLALVILVLLLRNVDAMKQIIGSVTGLFARSFEAVTEVGDF